MDSRIKIFLSYTSSDTPIADLVDRELQCNLGELIRISRYTRDVENFASFRKFMNSISQHDFVLAIISKQYLQSQACLYEVGEVIRDHNFSSRLLFLVVTDNDKRYYNKKINYSIAANVYDQIARNEYVVYWEDEYKKRKASMMQIDDPIRHRSALSDLVAVRRILDHDIIPFMDHIAEVNGPSLSEEIDNGLYGIVKAINPGYDVYRLSDEQTFESILRKAIKTVTMEARVDYAQILLAKTGDYDTQLHVVVDQIAPQKQKYVIALQTGIIGKCWRTGKSINVGNAKTDPSYIGAVSSTCSELALPVKLDGATIGVINIESAFPNHFTDSIYRKMIALSNELGVALRNAEFTAASMSDLPYISLAVESRWWEEEVEIDRSMLFLALQRGHKPDIEEIKSRGRRRFVE